MSPEKYIEGNFPDHIAQAVIDWSNGIETTRQKFDINGEYPSLEKGESFSPFAVKQLLYLLTMGWFEEKCHQDRADYHFPLRNKFLRYTSAIYGYLTNIFSLFEFLAISENNQFNPYLDSNQEEINQDLIIGSTPFLPYVCHDTASTAKLVEKYRKTYPNKNIILVHGKFNTIPHLGYFTLLYNIGIETIYKSDLEKTSTVYDSPYITIVSTDSNMMLQNYRYSPFLDEAWRISFLRLLPNIDVVSTTRDYDGEDRDDYWDRYYAKVKPDYIHIDSTNPNLEKIKERCKKHGIKLIEIKRENSLPVNNYFFDKILYLSASRILESTVAPFSLTNLTASTLIKKYFRELLLFGRKNPFLKANRGSTPLDAYQQLTETQQIEVLYILNQLSDIMTKFGIKESEQKL